MYPGFISWNDTPNPFGIYEVSIYNVAGELVHRTSWYIGADQLFADQPYCVDDFLMNVAESGIYRFSIQAINEYDESLNSDVAYSGWWQYTKPARNLSVPTGYYLDGTVLRWAPVANADGYRLDIGYSETANGDIRGLGGTWWRYGDETDYDLKNTFNDSHWWKGAGYYHFRVRSLSNDITKYCNSGYSPYIKVYCDENKNLSCKENAVYSVTFDDNYNGGGKTSRTVTAGTIITKMPIPTRDGYVFKGWYPNQICVGRAWDFATNKVTYNLTLYAKWEKVREFSLPDDVLPFTNNGVYFCTPDYWEVTPSEQAEYHYEITDSDYSKLLKNYAWYDVLRRSVLKKQTTTYPWGGSCFGMSSVAMLAYCKKLNPSNFGYSTIDEMEIYMNSRGCDDVGKVESLVNYYQLIQAANVIREKKNDYSKTNESINLKKLVAKMNNQKGKPVSIGLTFENASGSHRVLVYDLQYDSIGQKYAAKIYDSSMSAAEHFPLTIYKNGDLYTKNCQAWESAWGYGSIFITDTLTADDILELPVLLLSETGENAETNSEYELTTDFDSFAVSDGTNTVTVSGGAIQGEDPIGVELWGNRNLPGYPISFETRLPALDTGSYTITPLTDAESYDLTLYFDDAENGFFHAVEAAEPVQVTVSADGTVVTGSETAVKQTVSSAFNGTQMGGDSLTLEGETTGLTVSVEGTAVAVTAAEETEATLSITSGLKEQAVEQPLLLGNAAVTLNAVSGDETACQITQNGVDVAQLSLGYAVAFDSCGGSGVETAFVANGEAVSEPEEPERLGYLLEGWYEDPDYEYAWDFSTEVTGDTILYAKWEEDPDYWKKVTFRIDGVEDQILKVPFGTILTENDLLLTESVDYAEITWDSEGIAELLSAPVWSDTVIFGTLEPLYQGETLSVADVKYGDGEMTVSVHNNAAAAFSVTVMAAAYDEAGKLLEACFEPITAVGNGDTSVGISFMNPDWITEVQCFLTYGNHMVPLCESVNQELRSE